MKMKIQLIKNCVMQRKQCIDACIRKEERFKINDLSFHLRKLEKEDQIKFKVSER